MASSAAVHSLLGETIDQRYAVTRSLGTGAMGQVYEAQHLRLHKAFAIKVIHRELAVDPQFAARFEREALSTSRLKHPNCVEVTDYGQLPSGELYLVMELLVGDPLSRLTATPWPLDRALDITAQILRGLRHAHAAGVVHRDIKPDNIIVVQHPDGGKTAKIVDFGIAKLISDNAEHALTSAGLVLGTPTYMAPEQAAGHPIDARIDLYATGVMLWEMVTAKPLFRADNALGLLPLKVHTDAPTLSKFAPEHASSPVETVLATALQRDPAARYQNADAFLKAVEAAGARQPVPSGGHRPRRRLTTQSPRQHRARWRQRIVEHWNAAGMRRRLALLAAMLLVLGTATWMALSRNHGPPPNPLPVAGSERSRSEAPATPDSAKPKLPAHIRDRLRQARAAIVSKQCAKAERVLAGLQLEVPDLARVHYYQGAARLCLHDHHAGLQAYRRAIELDARYRNDPRIVADMGALIELRRTRKEALALVRDELGKAAVPVLLPLTTDRRRKLRHEAIAAVERLGAGNEIDWVEALALDLQQEPGCKARQKVIKKLRDLDDPRALDVLRRARDRRRRILGFIPGGYRHGCVRKQIIEAIEHLERQLD